MSDPRHRIHDKRVFDESVRGDFCLKTRVDAEEAKSQQIPDSNPHPAFAKIFPTSPPFYAPFVGR